MHTVDEKNPSVFGSANHYCICLYYCTFGRVGMNDATVVRKNNRIFLPPNQDMGVVINLRGMIQTHV